MRNRGGEALTGWVVLPPEVVRASIPQIDLGLQRSEIKGASLLGLVSSYWDYDVDARRKHSVHAGLAIVVPADDILTLLEGQNFMAEREKIAKEERDKRPTPKPAAAHDIPPGPIDRAGFERALRKTSRRVAPPARGKKGT